MSRSTLAALAAAVLIAPAPAADDPVPVAGAKATYPRAAAVTVKDRTVKLDLTGVAVRKKLGVTAYAVASYLQAGADARTAEDVLKADAVRMLHLVMERTAQPAEFIGALRAAVGKSYPAEKFEAEFKQLAEAVGERAAAKGDHVTLLWVPGSGVRVRMADKVDVTVKGEDFARALWEIYLGPKPVDEAIKKGLVGMLPPK